MTTPISRILSVALAGTAAVAAAPVGDVQAQDFYAGKQIRMIVGTGPSGAYDTYAKIMAEHWPRHIPGKPIFVVQHMPGASSINATNFIYNVAEKDGLTVGAVNAFIPTGPLLAPKEAKFDVTKMNWLGSITSDPFIGYLYHTAKVKTYEDAKKEVAILGGPSVESTGIQMALLSNAFFGTKFKMVVGYGTTGEAKLAMERGEIEGTFGQAYQSLKLSNPEWIRNKTVNIIIQHGLHRHADMPDVPTFIEQAKNDLDRQALYLMEVRNETAKPFIAPPGVPADRIAILKKSFADTLKDPAFKAALEKAELTLTDPMDSEQLTKVALDTAKIPQAAVDRVQNVFEEYARNNKK
jgi:tripartite-type tricarboxylate transporter receptor subunit TctC